MPHCRRRNFSSAVFCRENSFQNGGALFVALFTVRRALFVALFPCAVRLVPIAGIRFASRCFVACFLRRAATINNSDKKGLSL